MRNVEYYYEYWYCWILCWKCWMSLGNCKLNQQWDTTIRLLEWPKQNTLLTPDADKTCGKWGLSFITGRNAKWCSHFARLFGGISFKTEHGLTIRINSHTPWYSFAQRTGKDTAKQTLAQGCVQLLQLQLSKLGSNQYVQEVIMLMKIDF